MHEPADVLVAAYQDLDAARTDFNGLTALVASERIPVEGVILISHEIDGKVSVYAFTGTVKGVVSDLPPAHHEVEHELHQHHQQTGVAAGVAA